MSAEPQAIKTKFLGALDKTTGADRVAYLDDVCAGDLALRERLEKLLKLHDQPDGVLDQPAAEHIVSDMNSMALDFLEPPKKPGSLGYLGHYDVLEVAGKGGMGLVFRAFDEKLRRIVAIKALAPALADNATARMRFVREAQAAAAITHDNVIAIHAVEDTGPVPYLVMQFIDGCTLQQKLDRTGPLPVQEVLRVGVQVAEGLAAAHKHGLTHRDIKPANILLENSVERVKITDFGLARAADDINLTGSGYIAGTPAYMSPEQANSQRVDHRSDLFSLGSVLYSLCAGHPPFQGETSLAVLKRVCDETPKPLRDVNPDVPEWLEAFIARLQAKNPADRFATASEVAKLLDKRLAQFQADGVFGEIDSLVVTPVHSRKLPAKKPHTTRNIVAAALVVVAVSTASWFAYQTWFPKRQPANTGDPISPDPGAVAEQPWKPQSPLTPEELAKLSDPLDAWSREGLPAGTLALLRRDEKDELPELIGLLGDGPFRLPNPQITHWPVQSRDGRLLALPCGNDVILYDAQTGALRRKLTGHSDRAFRGGFSSDGKRYACGSMNGGIRIWEVESGKEEAVTQESADLWTTQFAPGDKQVLVGGGKGGVRVWDMAAGLELKSFGEHTGAIHHFTFNPARTQIASGCKGGIVKICSWPDGVLLKSLEGHDKDVLMVAYSSNGALLATGSTSEVMIWDAATFQLLHTLETAGDGLVAFTPDGETLVTAPHLFPAGRKRAFSRWDVKKGSPLGTFEVPGPRSFLVGDLSRDGRTVYLMSCGPGEPRLGGYDAVTGKDRFPNQSLAATTWSVAISPDGRWLASAGNDGQLALWDLSRPQNGDLVFPARQLIGHKGEVWCVAYSPDGQLLASAGEDGTIRLWKVLDGQELHVQSGYTFPAALLTFSADGETLAVGSQDGANLWTVKTGQPKPPVRWHFGPVRAVAFSADGRWFASGGLDRSVQLVDLASGVRVREFRGDAHITGVAFSPDSQQLAAISSKGPSLYHWELASKEGRTFTGHDKPVMGIAYHPAGNRVATASWDRTVRLWEPGDATVESRVIDFRHLSVCNAVSFSPSGRHFAVGLGNGTIALLRTPAR